MPAILFKMQRHFYYEEDLVQFHENPQNLPIFSPSRRPNADNIDSVTLADVQITVNSLAAMVNRLLENGGDLHERLDDTEADAPGIQDPFADTVTISSLRNSMSSSSIEPYPQQRLVSDDSEDLPAAMSGSSGFNSLMELEFQQSRVYSRTKKRHSISSKPSSFNPASRWSTISSISLADISNISVISLPLSASEIWGFEHYKSTYTPQSVPISGTGGSPNTQWPKTDIGESSGRRTFASVSPSLPDIAEDNTNPHIKMLLLGELGLNVPNSRLGIS